ncbi:hypothetical protein [Floridanema evergladense]|uniref:Orc1-like AAA ATPase domain-containing protein n=1 Tax=Floridaenema evergladense BLCC-F167 TaxID=3153639 RepID=A0ABV4WNA4_9CYAN
MTTTTSTIDNLIANYNPFAGRTIVQTPQIWGKSFPDVSSINAHASNAVFEAVKLVHQRQRQTVGITIRGEKGLGKTQIISRIRHCLQTDNTALFVCMNKYDDLNQINYQFLQNVVSSLRSFGSCQGIMQWQEVATALINDAKNWTYTPQQYMSMFPVWLNKYSDDLVERLTNLVLQNKTDINNPYLVKAILWTLSPDYANYATHWLSGLELAEEQAKTMGLNNPKKEEKDLAVLTTARQILDIISDYKVPVICFDELDEANVSKDGLTVPMVIASLAKDLSNNIKRGILLMAVYDSTWQNHVRALPQAEAVIDRIANYPIQREPVDLKFLNSDDVVLVVSEWLREFYEKHQQTPPSSLYPFDANKLRELGKQKPTVRDVLKWCGDHFNTPNVIIKPSSSVEVAFKTELVEVEENIEEYLEADWTISYALWIGFLSLMGKTVEGVEIEDVVEVESSAGKKGYIDFKIIGKEKPAGKQKRRTVKIGVAVVQQSGGFLTAALNKLIDYRKFDLTRGCLVRSKEINPGAKVAKEYARILLKEKGGEWVKLEAEHIKPLLAIQFVYEKKESYQLSDEEIFDFIDQKGIAINNPLIREILSDPSGQEPSNLTADGLPMSIPQSVPDLSLDIDLSL